MSLGPTSPSYPVSLIHLTRSYHDLKVDFLRYGVWAGHVGIRSQKILERALGRSTIKIHKVPLQNLKNIIRPLFSFLAIILGGAVLLPVVGHSTWTWVDL